MRTEINPIFVHKAMLVNKFAAISLQQNLKLHCMMLTFEW